MKLKVCRSIFAVFASFGRITSKRGHELFPASRRGHANLPGSRRFSARAARQVLSTACPLGAAFKESMPADEWEP